MDDETREHDENNTARLVRAALGPEARPGPQAGARMLARMTAELRARRPVEFPDRALVALAGLLAAAAGAGAGYRVPGAGDIVTLAVSALLVVNLIMVSVAGAVIVLRRRRG